MKSQYFANLPLKNVLIPFRVLLMVKKYENLSKKKKKVKTWPQNGG
jgi:hypothetical protein